MSTTAHAPRRVALIVLVALIAASGTLGARPAAARPSDGAPRIVGGTQAAPKAWPSQVALLDNRVKGPAAKALYCGGTVVNRSWVLTAAACVTFTDGSRATPGFLDVLVGTQSLAQGGTRIHVAEIRVIPGWNYQTYERDVALLRLATPTAAPAMPITAQGEAVPVGTSLIATGWGATTFGDPNTPTELRQATLTQLSNDVCTSDFGTQFHPAAQTCVSGAGQDTCTRDVGGPLAARRGSKWVLVGLSRVGDGCGRYPAVYVRLESYANWIRSQIAPASVITVSAKLSATKVPVRASVTVSGVVKPAKASPAVALQRKVGARWIDIGTGRVDPATGAYRIAIRPSTAGVYTFRVRTAGTKAVSTAFFLKVG